VTITLSVGFAAVPAENGEKGAGGKCRELLYDKIEAPECKQKNSSPILEEFFNYFYRIYSTRM